MLLHAGVLSILWLPWREQHVLALSSDKGGGSVAG